MIVHTETMTQVAQAEALLRELLPGGPVKPVEVRAEAQRRGLSLGHGAWVAAKKRVGAVSFRVGATWYWSFAADAAADLEDDLAVWLATPAGRFARYAAERDRLGPPEPGQLGLDEERGWWS